jgi:hypothetical protein
VDKATQEALYSLHIAAFIEGMADLPEGEDFGLSAVEEIEIIKNLNLVVPAEKAA